MNRLAQIDLDAIKSAAGLGAAYPKDVGSIMGTALKFIFPGAGILLLIYLIFGGFSLMTSSGDPKAISAAKGKITSALIGFVIVFAAYWIVQITGLILGLGDIKEIFK